MAKSKYRHKITGFVTTLRDDYAALFDAFERVDDNAEPTVEVPADERPDSGRGKESATSGGEPTNVEPAVEPSA